MNDTVIFLVLAGLALVFKFLNREKPEETRTQPPPRSAAPVPRAPAQSEEEKIRRFMEALGAPPGSRPPPPVKPRAPVGRRVVTPTPTPASAGKARPKPKRTWAQPLPPIVTTPPPEMDLPPLVTVPESVIVEVAPLLPTKLEPPRPVVRQKTATRNLPVAAPVRGLSLGERLRSAGSAREAMILREVLGPPRGLQPIDFAQR